MAIKPSHKQINEIAEHLECGMRCYFNLKTGEIKTIINMDTWEIADEEIWQDEINEIEKNAEDYFKFEGMNSHESFNLMVDFTNYIDNIQLKERLIKALNRAKPFRNFKWEIDKSVVYRQHWFDYKTTRYIQLVNKQIELFKRDFEKQVY
ncbi:MAG: UPF0158 family protein [Carboxylicivirga sp.]|jgi:hypothetical protein|nr:UPF0158 family protein [Carboxylicivirga sp.]MCT4645375.1 UPF0158 family protein [Carboxylicivirga sp.]